MIIFLEKWNTAPMNNSIIFLYTIQAFLHVFLCVFIAYKCFEHRLRFSKKNSIIVSATFVIACVADIELFLERTAPFGEFRLFGGICMMSMAVLYALIVIRVDILKLMFLVFFLLCATLKVTAITYVIYNLKLFPQTEISYIITSICVLAAVSPFMWYLCVKLFAQVVTMDMQGNHLKWLFVLPCANYLVYLSSGNKYMTESGWFVLLALLASSLVSYLAYVAVLQMFLKMHDSILATAKTQLAEQMIHTQKEQYDKIAEYIQRTARIEHDFRHNLIVIQGFCNQQNWQGLNDYLRQYESTAAHDTQPLSNNHFVDLILRHFVSRAQSEHITIHASVLFPEGFRMPDTESVVLFGNLCENALESCMRQSGTERFIEIQTKTLSQSMLAVLVTNSYDGTIIPKGDLFESSKHSGSGIGVSTIRYICEKSGGNCNFSYENGIFSARILLMSTQDKLKK